MKNPVVITSLGMRFYRSNGWTEEVLTPYLTGSLKLRGFGINESEDQYWILDVGSRLDVKKMLDDEVIGDVLCKEQYGELKGLSDLEVLNHRNW
jgi:hypothetical protein